VSEPVKSRAVHDEALKAEIARLRTLCARAADALVYETIGRHSQMEILDHSKLIAELRKAAQ
jgi:hypothetical protein